MNKHYKVTFTYVEKKEWKSKTTREIEVDCEDEYRAMLTVADEHDSIKFDPRSKMFYPANRKIHIDKVEEIKEKKNIEDKQSEIKEFKGMEEVLTNLTNTLDGVSE